MSRILVFIVLLFLSRQSFAVDDPIRKYLFIGGTAPAEIVKRLTDDVEGVQVVYSWRSLETTKGVYDFAAIERDLGFLTPRGKKLWVQLQDRFFREEDRLVPEYLLTDSAYQGGLARQKDNPGEGLEVGRGWVSKQWNPHVRERFQKLIAEIARQFDGRIAGINLPETSADIDIKLESKNGFTCDEYFRGTTENIVFARGSFSKSAVVQYVNFWPCEWDNDHKYMSRFFETAIEKKIGLGGPDIVPFRKGQMKNSYPFFNKHKNKLALVAFAVQEPTRTYTNPKTGRKFTDEEFLDFGRSFLGARIIFWSSAAF